MTHLFVRSLPYLSDSAELFERLVGLQGAVFLDSGQPVGETGRFDVLAALPERWISSRGGTTEVRCGEDVRVYRRRDPLEIVRECIAPLKAFEAYPFLTGAIGYVAYDFGRQIENLPEIAVDEEQLPDLMFGIYNWAVVVDHSARQTALLGLRADDSAFEAACALLEERINGVDRGVRPQAFTTCGAVRANMSKQVYFEKFARVKRYIRDGDCYQVNLAQKFSVPVAGDPWDAYRCLRKINPAPFSAYLDFGDHQVLSFSPERFLHARAGHIETKPIKGTRPRRADTAADAAEAGALRNSDKDRAENLMIVDLLRNDISKSCRSGSVKVSRLFDVESFANVHHLVSTIEGDFEEGKDALDLLKGCFPGGSITGAPKLRAMEIIEELEPHRRGIYCGAIGYISRHGDMDMNIAIRTVVHCDGRLSFFAGGGLVADSAAESEYQESLDKVSPMFDFFGEPSE